MGANVVDISDRYVDWPPSAVREIRRLRERTEELEAQLETRIQHERDTRELGAVRLSRKFGVPRQAGRLLYALAVDGACRRMTLYCSMYPGKGAPETTMKNLEVRIHQLRDAFHRDHVQACINTVHGYGYEIDGPAVEVICKIAKGEAA